MRVNGRFIVLASGAGLMLAAPFAAPLAVAAQTLPPAPYAADLSQYPSAGSPAAPSAAPQTFDRYGGEYRRSAYTAQSSSLPATAQAGQTLNWSGKVEAQAPAPRQVGGWAAAPQMQAQVPYQPAQLMQAKAPTNPWRPYQPQGQFQRQPGGGGQPAWTPPASIYDPPPLQQAQAPAPQPYRQAQASAPPNPQGGPRFYSLHREYGIQPDPIPLPPQFFGPTADLSTPVGEPLAKRTTVVNGQTKTVNVPDDQGAQ